MCHTRTCKILPPSVWQLVTLLMSAVHLAYGCGGLIDTTNPSDSGVILSPNYPSAYTHKTNCIWLIQGPSGRTVRLTVHELSAEASATGQCLDTMEVRAGSATAVLLYSGCSVTTNITIESPNRWLWLQFRSNEKTALTGFNSSWEITSNAENSSFTKEPFRTCRSYLWLCPNKECIEQSWVCDGYNDCGCTTWGCDESNCMATRINDMIRFIVGIGTGIVVFVLAVFISMWRERTNPWPPFKKSDPFMKKDKK